jgi:hypothetical protein
MCRGVGKKLGIPPLIEFILGLNLIGTPLVPFAYFFRLIKVKIMM